MSDKAKIVAGLLLFLVVVALPVWYPLGASGNAARPELELPEGESNCVEPTEFMTANHMQLLHQWRNAVVREGETEYVSSTGERYVMSLTGTCLDCHSNRDAFCNRCHEYSDVAPRCFDCHTEPEGG